MSNPIDDSRSLSEARRLIELGELKAAASELELLLDREARSPEILRLLGSVRIRQKFYRKGIGLLVLACRADELDPKNWTLIGQELLRLRRPWFGKRALERAARLPRGSSVALDELAQLAALEGEAEECIRLCRGSLELEPSSVPTSALLMDVLLQSGRTVEAEQVIESSLSSVRNAPPMLYHGARLRSRRGDIEGALELYRRLASHHPQLAAVVGIRATSMLSRRGLHEKAIEEARRTLELAPEEYESAKSLGHALKSAGKLREAFEVFRVASARLRAPYQSSSEPLDTFRMTTRAKLLHDIEQLRHLKAEGNCNHPVDFAREVLRGALDALPTNGQSGALYALDERTLLCVAPYYNRCLHRTDPQELPQGALATTANWESVDHRISSGQDAFAVVDEFLQPDALAALLKFCRNSTIWYQSSHANGFLGAYMDDGFDCPLLEQVVRELQALLPRSLGSLGLHNLWAYSYGYGEAAIDLHADSACVNVNFWIAPEESNLDPDTGGMTIWNQEAPPDWKVHEYNGGNSKHQADIRTYLNSTSATSTSIPHRQNRAVIFRSKLFHQSHPIQFRSGFLHRRINITALFGTHADRFTGSFPGR